MLNLQPTLRLSTSPTTSMHLKMSQYFDVVRKWGWDIDVGLQAKG